jgi:hypothetical protein
VGGWLEALTPASSDSYTVPPYGVSHEAVVWAQCSAPILLLAQSRSLCFAQHVSEGMCRVVLPTLLVKEEPLHEKPVLVQDISIVEF